MVRAAAYWMRSRISNVVRAAVWKRREPYCSLERMRERDIEGPERGSVGAPPSRGNYSKKAKVLCASLPQGQVR